MRHIQTYKIKGGKLQTGKHFVAHEMTKILIFNIYQSNTTLHRKVAN